MVYDFIKEKIPRDFMVKKGEGYISPLEQLAQKHNVSKACIIKCIVDFIKDHPRSAWRPYLRRKLKVVLVKEFLEFRKDRDDFIEEYGLNEKYFVRIMKEIVDDSSILSDSLANKVFIKLVRGHNFKVASVPARIIRIIGEYYVNPNAKFTQEVLGRVYGISDSSISCILRRGISESIYDDTLANKVYMKVSACRYFTQTARSLYVKAFDLREG